MVFIIYFNFYIHRLYWSVCKFDGRPIRYRQNWWGGVSPALPQMTPLITILQTHMYGLGKTETEARGNAKLQKANVSVYISDFYKLSKQRCAY